MTTYTKIFEKNQYDLANAVTKSQSWFQQQARLLGAQNLQPLKMITSDASRNVTRIVPGEMYMFMYDPKLKETLPYYDMFPLVFPFSKTKDGFIGLNMHYLPYKMRIVLLDRLMEFKTSKNLTEDTRLKYSWATIAGASKFQMAQPCVHRYLNNQLQTPLKRIDPKDWATALMLPVERFVGTSKQRVWTESLR